MAAMPFPQKIAGMARSYRGCETIGAVPKTQFALGVDGTCPLARIAGEGGGEGSAIMARGAQEPPSPPSPIRMREGARTNKTTAP